MPVDDVAYVGDTFLWGRKGSGTRETHADVPDLQYKNVSSRSDLCNQRDEACECDHRADAMDDYQGRIR